MFSETFTSFRHSIIQECETMCKLSYSLLLPFVSACNHSKWFYQKSTSLVFCRTQITASKTQCLTRILCSHYHLVKNYLNLTFRLVLGRIFLGLDQIACLIFVIRNSVDNTYFPWSQIEKDILNGIYYKPIYMGCKQCWMQFRAVFIIIV